MDVSVARGTGQALEGQWDCAQLSVVPQLLGIN